MMVKQIEETNRLVFIRASGLRGDRYHVPSNKLHLAVNGLKRYSLLIQPPDTYAQRANSIG